jgi:hypothetical protein
MDYAHPDTQIVAGRRAHSLLGILSVAPPLITLALCAGAIIPGRTFPLVGGAENLLIISFVGGLAVAIAAVIESAVRRRRLLLPVISCVAHVTGALIVLVLIGRALGIVGGVSFDLKRAEQVAAQVATGTLTPDNDGVVKLPPAFANLSIRDEAYVTTDAGGTTWILFRTWQGKGMNLRGHLHRSTPAPGAPPATITVLGPVLRRLPTDPPTAPIDYTVDAQDAPNWYRVRFDLN